MTSPHLNPETAVAKAYGLALDPAESAAIDGHLGGCSDCARRLKALRDDRDALAGALRELPRPAEALPPPPALRRRRPWIESLAAALCLAAAGFGLFGSWRDRQPAGASQEAVERDLQGLAGEDPALRQAAFDRLMKTRGALEAELRRALEKGTDPELKARLEVLLQPHEIARLGGLVCAHSDGSLRYSSLDKGAGFSIGPEQRRAPLAPLAWSPDGKRLAYRTLENPIKPGPLFVLDILSNESVRISLEHVQTPVWSPDSQKLAFATPEGILVASSADWETKPLRIEGVPCFFSRDGAQLYLWRPTRIERLDLASRQSVLVAEAASPAALSPDGASIYYFGPADGRVSYGVSSFPLMRLDLATGAERVLKEGASVGESTPTVLTVMDRPTLSPRGNFVAWARATPEGAEIRLAERDGLRLRSLGVGIRPAWAPGGARLAYELSPNETRILDLDSAQEWSRPGSSPVWAPTPNR